MGRLNILLVAFLDRANIIVTGTVAMFVLYSRSSGVTYFALASVACSVTVKIIKRFVRQARPPAEPWIQGRVKKSYGMPSTHSAVVSFQSAYVLLACHSLPIHPSFPQNMASRIVPPLIVLPWATAIMASRVGLGYHTWAQVLAGLSYGVLFSAVAFGLWTHGWNEHGKLIESFVEDELLPVLKSYCN